MNIIKTLLSKFTISLVVLAPFFLGLYFEGEMSIHHYFVALTSLLVSFLLIRQSNAGNGLLAPIRPLVTSPYFLALAALTALYGLSFLQAINPREALFVWLRHIDYLLTFVLVFLGAGMGKKDGGHGDFISWVLIIFATTGTVIAAGGVLAAQGIISIPEWLPNGRLASVFHYPNAFAAYLMAAVLITLHLGAQNNRPYKAGALAGMGFVLFLAIIGSQSRGVWMMLPFVLVILFLGQRVRSRFIWLTIATLGLAMILSPITVARQVQQLQPNWGAFLITLAGALAVGTAWGYWAVSRGKPVRILIVLLAGLVLVNFLPGGDIPQKSSTVSRLKRIDTGERSYQARMVYYADALKMVHDRPLLGWGGGGWKYGYGAYQSLNYHSTVVHSHFIQVWVETGTLGLAAFTLPFLFLMLGLWRLYFSRPTHPVGPQTWTIGVTVLALGIHGAVDFDLSYSSIALLLWALLAMFAYREKLLSIGVLPLKQKESRQDLQGDRDDIGKASRGLTLLFIIGITLTSLHLAASTYTLRSAAARAQDFTLAVQKGDGQAALEHIQKAASLDRWSALYLLQEARLLMALRGRIPDQDPRDLVEQSIDLAHRAVELDRYNPEGRFVLARLYLADGQLEKALAEAEGAIKYKPWLIATYEEFNRIYVEVAVAQLLRGQEEDAGRTLRRVLAVTQEALTKKDSLSPQLQKLWDNRWDLNLTPALALASGQSALLLEDYKLAKTYLNTAAQSDNERIRALGQLWLGAALQKTGDPAGEELMEEARRSGPEAEAQYVLIKQLIKINK